MIPLWTVPGYLLRRILFETVTSLIAHLLYKSPVIISTAVRSFIAFLSTPLAHRLGMWHTGSLSLSGEQIENLQEQELARTLIEVRNHATVVPTL